VKNTDSFFYNGMANDLALRDPKPTTDNPWDVPFNSSPIDGVILVAGNTATNVSTKLAQIQGQFGFGSAAARGATATIVAVNNTSSTSSQCDGKVRPGNLQGHEQYASRSSSYANLSY
jgi:hypothetical protein